MFSLNTICIVNNEALAQIRLVRLQRLVYNNIVKRMTHRKRKFRPVFGVVFNQQ